MPELIEIVKEHAAAVQLCGITVTINTGLGAVEIAGEDGEAIFLDGVEGEDFITQRAKLYEDLQHVTYDQVELYLAHDWMLLLGE